MMRESRMATFTTNIEMDITWEIALNTARKEIVEKYDYNERGKHLFKRNKER
ncbi:MAG: hypothetical protein OEM82_02325 [Acidobacteriota bacterium]|nr:hypothetical protein [Acidobacteriota bacterium]MDH3528324.1 hypothetical protein [Acidobacteriota bacterium]